MKRRDLISFLTIFTILIAPTGCGSVTEELARNIEISKLVEVASNTNSAKLYVAGEYDEEMQMLGIGWWLADSSKIGEFQILSDGELLAELTGEDYWDEEENLFFYAQDFKPIQETYVFTVGNGTSSADVILRQNEDGHYEFEENDSDGDGLSDLDELWEGTDPENPDTDGDGFPDGFEYENGLDPLTPDTEDSELGQQDHDLDGLTDLEEYRIGTNPYAYDTDEDGFSDGYEMEKGMNPLAYDEIVLDDAVLEELYDYSIEDIETLNLDEYYPLVIDYNDDLVTGYLHHGRVQ